MSLQCFRQFSDNLNIEPGKWTPRKRKLAKFLSTNLKAFINGFIKEKDEDLEDAYERFFFSVMRETESRRNDSSQEYGTWNNLVSNWGKTGAAQSGALVLETYYYLHTIKNGKSLAKDTDILLLKKTYEQCFLEDVPGGYSEDEAIFDNGVFDNDPPRKLTEIHSYAYDGANKIKVLGRGKEEADLLRFLKDSHEKKFLWLQLAGVAGQGKSRLGWDLIQRARNELDWQAGFLRLPKGRQSEEEITKFLSFWQSWKPSEPYLFVLDYVITTGPIIGPFIQALIERCASFHYPVRLLLLERQRWDRGGFTLEHQPEDEDESTSDLVQTNGRAAWFEDLQDEAPRHNIADPDFLFDRNGIIELKHLSSDDLVKITRQIFKIETGGHDLLRGQEELEKFLKRIDRNGRPLYAYFLGKALATGKFESGWGREELLREVLTHDQKKRWISAFRKKTPDLRDDIDSLNIAVLATMAEGIPPESLLDLEEAPNIEGEILLEVMTLVDGPFEKSIASPSEIIPPLLPDILGEWLAINTLKWRRKEKRKQLVQQAWSLSSVGTARFIQRVAADFPEQAIELGIFEKPSNSENLSDYLAASAQVASSLIQAGVKIPQSVLEALMQAANESEPAAMNLLGYLYWQGKDLPKNDRSAFEMFRKSANCKHPAGMRNFAISLSGGIGCDIDKEKAFHWFQEASASGDRQAMRFLGVSYMNGDGVDKDPAKAIEWWEKAAEAGDTTAMRFLGVSYKTGDGVDKDPAKAIEWWEKAAEAGDTTAMRFLGVSYKTGDGVDKDPAKAIEWWEKAAEAGDTTAMRFLGVSYKTGDGVDKDPAKAIEWWEKAAEAGDTTAMVNLGVSYKTGDGVDKDPAKAIEWWEKAAEAGDTTAMRFLGVSYKTGDGVDKDPAKAIEWWEKAAEAGDTTAMVNLGVSYENGNGVDKDPAKAIEWYQKAAEAGDTTAMVNLGVSYKTGDGVDKDPAKAIEWYQKAVEAGDTTAMVNLGVSYENGNGVDKDPAKAIEWYQKAAEAGDTTAMVNLGVSYKTGDGVDKDPAKAIEWYQKAAEAGDTTAMRFLGVSYENGDGVDKDPAKAIEWYQKAAEAGDTTAMRFLGVSYENGDGVDKDPAKAIEWWEKAAEAGDTTAMRFLGVSYENGDGVDKDPAKAIEWWEKAAEAGDTTAMRFLGVSYKTGDGVDKDPAKAIEWYQKAAEAGDTTAMVNLGVSYKTGDGVDKDPAKAIEWYQEAAEAGDTTAMRFLGVSYKTGDGVDKDPAKAIEWYQKAAEAGDTTAMVNLGVSYKTGDGVDKDPAKAIEWYQKAAEAGDTTAMVNLGVSYMNGDGVDKDPAKAIEWYQKAAEAGDTTAMVNLGVSYMNGDGVDKDPAKAIEWYQKAAEAGDTTAMVNLGVSYMNGDGVDKDPAKAIEWYQKAAEAGGSEAASRLATLSAVLPTDDTLKPSCRNNTTIPSIKLTQKWMDQPPLQANWQNQGKKEAKDVAAKLAVAADLEGILGDFAKLSITAIRLTEIACYATLKLADIQLVDECGDNCFVSALISQKGAIFLDGQSMRLFTINPYCLSIDSQEKREIYLRLFCEYTHGDAGPFHIVRSMSELPIHDQKYIETLHENGVKIGPIEFLKPVEERALCTANAAVLYSDNLYASEFLIHDDGRIEMLAGNTIASDLPILRRKYIGIFRHALSHDIDN